ncbi:WcaJ Sugar transferases involved in lipopolysaccharide synthesis [Candidatus Methylopumilus planktonicus]|uniref:sugar transferase n=1 Tax=Candidatus Methylopumilus planktonicus TaxID=1581557 RepID=UPI003BEF276A
MKIYLSLLIYPGCKRCLDLLLLLISLILVLVPLVIITLLVRTTSNGPILFWSERIGQHNRLFKMPKFRTMIIEAPVLATHLLKNPNQYLTPIGSFLRKSSLDELPQLWSILVGDMTFVGPRPALFNQYNLIKLRNMRGIDQLLPGLTGWAQINGRDELSEEIKVVLDEEYLIKKSCIFDLKIIYLTVFHIIKPSGISH